MVPVVYDPVIVSVVVPLLDEADNLPRLHAETVDAMATLDVGWEIVYVDDGSVDAGPRILAELADLDPRVQVITLDRNHGQSTAMIAGAEAACGNWVATLDADGQNDPKDIPRMWEVITKRKCDGVTGVRVNRADGWVKRVASRIANGVRNRVLGDEITDVGCSTRILPKNAILSAARFEGMHRFLPTLVRALGYRIEELPVNHRPRIAGQSKYGINNRLWCGLADLLMVRRLLGRKIQYRIKQSRSAASLGAWL
ncbi:MAG: glycosyltransferase family 2 protein [Gemmatimonadota bacterium]|jgi:dolichol-phosphate mannosyltransferase